MLTKFRAWVSYFYQVPWCVPAWGWSEFCVTAYCILAGKIKRGSYSRQLSDAIRAYLGVKYVLPVNRGRTAIELALRALDLKGDDEVVLPSYVCRSVLDAILKVGVKPVFADIGPELHLTVDTTKAVITSRTKCIIVPHLFGNTAPIDHIERMIRGTGIALIDDAAQSFGSRRSGRLVGSFGDCGIISCGPGKALAGAAGGLLVTNRRELYDRAVEIPLGEENAAVVTKRILSFWVWRRFRKYTLPFKILIDRIVEEKEEPLFEAFQISNLDAGIALQQFQSLIRNTRKRQQNAKVLLETFGIIGNYGVSDFSNNSTLIKLVLVLSDGKLLVENLIKQLARAGIESQGGYVPLHQDGGNGNPSLPSTERLWKNVICIPLDIRYKNQRKLWTEMLPRGL
jgi:dTDP-4-amino-4,6-dideoxygalactose transaminase